MILVKVRTSDIELIVRSLYASDFDFINTSTAPGDSSLKLDALVKAVLDVSEDSYFFKVQGLNGALIGFFMVPVSNPQKVISYLFIKKSARTQEYMDAFYKLVSQTIYGGIEQSLGAINVTDIDSLLRENFTILVPLKPYGFNINTR